MKKNKTTKNTASQFSLVELLAIITILCILAVLMLPAASGTVNRAKLTACSNHLRQIGTATGSYTIDNMGFIPNIMPELEDSSIPIIRLPNGTLLALGRLFSGGYITDIKNFGCHASPGCEPEEIARNFRTTPMLWIAYLYRSQDYGFDPILSSEINQDRAYLTDFACVTAEGRNFAPHGYLFSNILFTDGHTECRENSPVPFEKFTIQAFRHNENTPDCTTVWRHTDKK